MRNPSFPQPSLVSRVHFRAYIQGSGSATGRTIPEDLEIYHLLSILWVDERGGRVPNRGGGEGKEVGG